MTTSTPHAVVATNDIGPAAGPAGARTTAVRATPRWVTRLAVASCVASLAMELVNLPYHVERWEAWRAGVPDRVPHEHLTAVMMSLGSFTNPVLFVLCAVVLPRLVGITDAPPAIRRRLRYAAVAAAVLAVISCATTGVFLASLFEQGNEVRRELGLSQAAATPARRAIP